MKKGFTLVELLIVVLIIGILAAVAVPQYMGAIERSRATEALVTGKALNDSLARYYQQFKKYPTAATVSLLLPQLDVKMPMGGANEDTLILQHFDASYTTNSTGPTAIFTFIPFDNAVMDNTDEQYEIHFVQTRGETYGPYCAHPTKAVDDRKGFCKTIGASFCEGGFDANNMRSGHCKGAESASSGD